MKMEGTVKQLKQNAEWARSEERHAVLNIQIFGRIRDEGEDR